MKIPKLANIILLASNIIFDSLAAMIPQLEVDDPLDKMQMAPMARMMSKALRKLTYLNKKTLIFFINQLRVNPGARYGCVHGHTRVLFEDGRSIKIRDIVEKKIKGKVWTFNEKKNVFEAKEIQGWHYNGKVDKKDDFVHIEARGIHQKNGIFGLSVTRKHLILTREGWKRAENIKLGDRVVTKYISKINNQVKDFLYGTLIGDCSLVKRMNTAQLRFRDKNNDNYLKWKISKLSKAFKFHKNNNGYVSDFRYELKKIKDRLKKRNPRIFLKDNFSYLGLALWFMDDVHFGNKEYHNRYILSVKRLSDVELLKASKLFRKLGLNNTLGKHCSGDFNGYISFNKKTSSLIASKIYRYVPGCMQYKLPKKYRNLYKEFDLKFNKEIKKEYTNVFLKRAGGERLFKTKGKYDLLVENNQNYLVGGKSNGIIVHAST